MAVSHELRFTSQSFNGLALSDRFIAGDVIDRLALQHIEPAVDPALFTMRLFLEAGNQVLFVLQTVESSRRLHGGDRGKLPMGMVKIPNSSDASSVPRSGCAHRCPRVAPSHPHVAYRHGSSSFHFQDQPRCLC